MRGCRPLLLHDHSAESCSRSPDGAWRGLHTSASARASLVPTHLRSIFSVESPFCTGMLRSAGSHARPLLKLRTSWRCFGTASPEQELEDKLRGSIDGVQHVKVSNHRILQASYAGRCPATEAAQWAAQVTDTSGGCGTMYDVSITADAFRHASGFPCCQCYAVCPGLECG